MLQQWLDHVDSLAGMPLGWLAVLVLVLALSVVIRFGLLFLATKWMTMQRLIPQSLDLSHHLGRPLNFMLFGALTYIVVPGMPLSDQKYHLVAHAIEIGMVVGATWFFLEAAVVGKLIVYFRFEVTGADNLVQRKVRTQIQFIYRTFTIFIACFGLSAILLSFDGFRKFGASLLASAGVAGVVIGFAAQRSLSNFIAGFQIAFTQPIRIDDVVLVEGEFGRVEEITLTYVIIKIWDLRRLVLPITYFIEKPFQNWTRTSADILGTVFFFADYRVPVDKIRAELLRILGESPLWDHKSGGLQVTDATDKTIQLRALMSARSAGDAWDLRCLVREKIIAFMAREYPEYLPRFRVDSHPPNTPA